MLKKLTALPLYFLLTIAGNAAAPTPQQKDLLVMLDVLQSKFSCELVSEEKLDDVALRFEWGSIQKFREDHPRMYTLTEKELGKLNKKKRDELCEGLQIVIERVQ